MELAHKIYFYLFKPYRPKSWGSTVQFIVFSIVYRTLINIILLFHVSQFPSTFFLNFLFLFSYFSLTISSNGLGSILYDVSLLLSFIDFFLEQKQRDIRYIKMHIILLKEFSYFFLIYSLFFLENRFLIFSDCLRILRFQSTIFNWPNFNCFGLLL